MAFCSNCGKELAVETRFVKDVFCEKRLNYKLED